MEAHNPLLATGWLREVWSYRELFYFFAWREVKLRYKQTVLGAAWAIIPPLFTMVVFTVLFGGFAKMPTDGIPPAIFYYSALVPWMYFSGALGYAGNSLLSNASLVTKVYFPRVALPASSVLSGLIDFGVASIVLVGMMMYYGVRPSWRLLMWPILVAPLAMLALGVGMLLAALNARYRDIKHAMPLVTQLWFFVTPIIYPASIVPERFRLVLALNPLTGLIEGFRASILPDRRLDWHLVGVSLALTLSIFAVSAIYFRRAERDFVDVI
jgi:homopolymeric O-antigen transport system permease protein